MRDAVAGAPSRACRRRSWRAPARPSRRGQKPRSRPRPAPRLVSLEEVEAGEPARRRGDDDVEIGDDVATDDDTFLEEEEEGEDDVAGLIDGDIEDDEET